jgi:hypothetical protein
MYIPGQIILTGGCARSTHDKKLRNQNRQQAQCIFICKLIITLRMMQTALIRSHGAQFACLPAGGSVFSALLQCLRCDWNFAITQPVISASEALFQVI